MSPILNETRYSLSQLARHVGVHVGTVWRWTLHGVRGHKLRTVVERQLFFLVGDN